MKHGYIESQRNNARCLADIVLTEKQIGDKRREREKREALQEMADLLLEMTWEQRWGDRGEMG